MNEQSGVSERLRMEIELQVRLSDEAVLQEKYAKILKEIKRLEDNPPKGMKQRPPYQDLMVHASMLVYVRQQQAALLDRLAEYDAAPATQGGPASMGDIQ